MSSSDSNANTAAANTLADSGANVSANAPGQQMDFKAALLHEQPSDKPAPEQQPEAPKLEESEWPELGTEPAPEQTRDNTATDSDSASANQSIKAVAIEKAVQLKDAVVHQANEFKECVREKGLQAAVMEKGTELKDVALTQGSHLIDAAKGTGVQLKDAAVHQTATVKEATVHAKDAVAAQASEFQGLAREKGYPAAVVERTTALAHATLDKAAETGHVVLESGRPLAQSAYAKGVQLQQTSIGQQVTNAALSGLHFAEGTIDKFASEGQKQFIHNAVGKAGEVVQQVKTAVLGPMPDQQAQQPQTTESRTH